MNYHKYGFLCSVVFSLHHAMTAADISFAAAEFLTQSSKDSLSFQAISFHSIKWLILKHQLLQYPKRQFVWNAVCILSLFVVPFMLWKHSHVWLLYSINSIATEFTFFFIWSLQEPKIKFDTCNQTGPYTGMSIPDVQWTVHATDVTSRIFILQKFFQQLLQIKEEKILRSYIFFARMPWFPHSIYMVRFSKISSCQQNFMVLKGGLFIHFEISSNTSGESLWHFSKSQFP
jgi:hypothetical protein